MARMKSVKLDESEKERLRATRQAVFGSDDVPYGVVVDHACRALLAQENDTEVKL